MSARAKSRIRRGDTVAAWIFIAPFLVAFALFFLVPSVVSAWTSFHSYRGYGTMRPVGFGNYQALFTSPSFWQAIRNTVFYWLVPLPVLLAGAFALALAVRSPIVRLGRIYRPLLFIPQMMAPVAAALVWQIVLAQNGAVNSILGVHIPWLTAPELGKTSVAVLLVWRALGWYFVIFLAGLTGISPDLLEAAQLDGANFVQSTLRVVVPLMRPIILFTVVIDTVGAIQLYAEPNLLLGGSGSMAGAPPSAAPLMNQVIENIAGGQYGLASAAGWIMFLGIGAFSLIQFRLLSQRK